MHRALNSSRSVIENSLGYLLSNDLNTFESSNVLDIDDIRIEMDDEQITTSKNDAPPQRRAKPKIELSSSSRTYQTVVIFNSLLNKRNEIVSIRVNTPNVEVIENNGGDKIKKLERVQVSLVWPNSDDVGGRLAQNHIPDRSTKEQLEPVLDFEDDSFELLFEVDIEPLSTKSFTIRLTNDPPTKRQSVVKFYSKADLVLDKDLQDRTVSEFNKK